MLYGAGGDGSAHSWAIAADGTLTLASSSDTAGGSAYLELSKDGMSHILFSGGPALDHRKTKHAFALTARPVPRARVANALAPVRRRVVPGAGCRGVQVSGRCPQATVAARSLVRSRNAPPLGSGAHSPRCLV
eukprot:SAG31_NODE_26054_length_449_cov_1.037143_1_plen_132_part_01